ncbi:MAG: complex I NDUFA9 subunit family protein [Burkholderiales bacterium]
MSITTICVLGGTGFVGRHVCAALAARGLRVRVPTRSPERAKHLTTLPTVELLAADIHDPATLNELFHGCDAVVNLVGVLHGGRGRTSFASAHIELARNVVNACQQSSAGGVRRVLHMSALNAATDGPSEYLRSKGEAEVVMRASGLDVTIFRPSVVFGPEDKFLNTFAVLLKCFPAMIVPAARARFQPVYVGDVAQVFAESLASQDSIGKSYDLCGPDVYTLRELTEFVACTTGHRRLIFGADHALTSVMAFAMECLPGKMMSIDNVRSMTVDSVCNGCVFPFGIAPQSVEASAPAWLAYRTPRGRYAHFRDRT